MSFKNKDCPHVETTITVVDAFDIHEMIAFVCTECGETVKTQTN